MLKGIGVAGYRSFGGDGMQVVGPMTKINLVAGQNNAGKSNILRVVHMIAQNGYVLRNDRLDAPLGSPPGTPTRVALPIEIDSAGIIQKFVKGGSASAHAQVLAKFFDHPAIRLTRDDLVWVTYRLTWQATNGGQQPGFDVDQEWLESLIESSDDNARQAVNEASMNVSAAGGSPLDDLKRVMESFRIADQLPLVQTVGAFRRIETSPGGSESVHEGRGLIAALQRLDRPPAGREEDEATFVAIQKFVQTVLEDDSVRIEVPHDATTINIRRGTRLLPIDSLGTGVHEVVVLAAGATLLKDYLICIEEPEIHLHPVLQRKLLSYLHDNTSNQYLIATHSAHLLDSGRASIFHATWSSTGTHVRRAQAANDRSTICADLGYRASDLVQTNTIVWVEGPSDRTYVNHWIALMASDLVEGLHYSIMFYGGRLLNHLSAYDRDIAEFISLRHLNRNVAIIIDSDKGSDEAQINETKQRVVKELEVDGFAWVTAGYTIENYVPESLMLDAIRRAHPGSNPQAAANQWENPLAQKYTERKGVDKVKIARLVTESWSSSVSLPLDLEARIGELVAFIRAASRGLNPLIAPANGVDNL